jgi:phosphopantothenoylcysteine synthetase/decarboxylase
MNILITAGNTQVPIDQVRCITNIFTGRTGAAIAQRAFAGGHRVTLLTSHPETIGEGHDDRGSPTADRLRVVSYRTFDDLRGLMEQQVRAGGWDAVIHSAAVSDYLSGGVFAPDPGTLFELRTGAWEKGGAGKPALESRDANKVKSDAPELWLRLIRAPKLVDLIRGEWGFRGLLVKFKLEVGINESQLLDIAEGSRRQSRADLMVANTLEGSAEWALLGPLEGGYVRVSRAELPDRLIQEVERGVAHG